MPHDDLRDRWTTFLAKLGDRLAAVVTEIDGALDEIARVDPVDPGPANGVESALQARIRQLDDKLDDAWAALDATLDERIDDASPAALPRVLAVRQELHALRQEMHARLERTEETTRVRGLARVGRALQERVVGAPTTQRCPPCGATYDPGTVWRSTNATCPHCGAVNTVGPSPLWMAWYSRGIRFLAEDAGLDAYLQMLAARAAFQALRHPTTADYQRYEAAHETHQRAVAAVMVQLHPGWDTERAERDVGGMVGQLRTLEHRPQAEAMRLMEEGIAAAGRGAGAVRTWLAEAVQDEATRTRILDDLLEAAAEREARDTAHTLVQVRHADELPWLFKGRWINARLAELTPAFA